MFGNKANAQAYGREITAKALKAGADHESAERAGKLAAAVHQANANAQTRKEAGLD